MVQQNRRKNSKSASQAETAIQGENPAQVPTQVKNPDLVDRRRRQIVDAAVHLFIAKGFHKTTTREIASSAGISIGSLYEYVKTKEDILYLVCDAIHREVEESVTKAIRRTSDGKASFTEAIREYFGVCERMSEHILLIYQETQSLTKQWRKKVLENEVRISNIFVDLLSLQVRTGVLPHMDEKAIELAAHDLTVLGHMWTFRGWFLKRKYTLDEYVGLQTDFILGISQRVDTI